MERVSEAMRREFRRDIEDGTVDVRSEGNEVRLDGGTWELVVFVDGRVATGLPTHDPNYYDDDTDAFLDKVFGTEV